MNDNSESSGFIGDITEETIGPQVTPMEEIYCSQSGFSRLFRCQRFGKRYIAKALKVEFVGNSFYEQLLKKEFDIGIQLDHVHICHTVSWEENMEIGHYILMEYVDGITLKQFMEQGKLTNELALSICIQICDALQYMHNKQIVHRDLKPINILITHNGNNVKLIDFGLSDSDNYSILKQPAGSRYYIAPEAKHETVSLDPRIDIYSLGIIMGEMTLKINNHKLAVISRKCTQQDKDKRYSSAQAVINALNSKHDTFIKEIKIAVVCIFLSVFCWSMYTIIIHRNDQDVPVASISYGNITMNSQCRRILSKESVRITRTIQQKGFNEVQLKNDSTQLMNTLTSVLDKDYPLQEQKSSTSYKKQYMLLVNAVNELMCKLRTNYR